MREIKFRAWDKFGEVMTTGQMYIQNSSGTLETPPGVFVMQFTGLKDKNGKECFIGDILKREWEGAEECTEVYADTMILRERGIYQGKKWDNFVMPTDIQKAEIIGNIYQNSDLLK